LGPFRWEFYVPCEAREFESSDHFIAEVELPPKELLERKLHESAVGAKERLEARVTTPEPSD
jgi:hypothetical protein